MNDTIRKNSGPQWGVEPRPLAIRTSIIPLDYRGHLIAVTNILKKYMFIANFWNLLSYFLISVTREQEYITNIHISDIPTSISQVNKSHHFGPSFTRRNIPIRTNLKKTVSENVANIEFLLKLWKVPISKLHILKIKSLKIVLIVKMDPQKNQTLEYYGL